MDELAPVLTGCDCAGCWLSAESTISDLRHKKKGTWCRIRLDAEAKARQLQRSPVDLNALR